MLLETAEQKELRLKKRRTNDKKKKEGEREAHGKREAQQYKIKK